MKTDMCPTRSTGKIGWGAVSYYATSAYQTAVLRPPHLAAIMPWEGISDIYREVNTVGGIPGLAFQQLWMNLTGNGLHKSEDHAVASVEHPFYDAWWQSKVVDWSSIDIPAFSVTGWSSLGLHLRGTIEAWKAFSSKQKYLLIHSGREWSEYYKDENVRRQKHFWDRFLNGEPNEVDNWPRVLYTSRLTADEFVSKTDLDFPPGDNTLHQYLITAPGTLTASSPQKKSPPAEPQYVSYTAHHAGSAAVFDIKFDKDTTVTGHSSAKLWVQALNHPDADLYLAIQKLDKEGEQFLFYHSTQKIEAPATLGWLRVSHRELDHAKSFPGRPYHTHTGPRKWLRPRDIVEVQVELWPHSTVWHAGETLRLAVQGSLFTNPDNPTQAKGPSHGFGEVRIWFGGQYDSSLLLPVQNS